MMKNESGRSMVEMLGVLAIIGVLSVGGIAGYTTAMKKYKANEIMSAASQCSILARSANAGAGDDECAVTWPSGVTVSSENPTVTAEGAVTITFDDEDICTAAAAIKTPTSNTCSTDSTATWSFS